MESQTINKVYVDLKLYDGVDLYTDGEIEEFLLDTVKNWGDVDYSTFIFDHFSWPVLYHLSPLREAITDWYPLKKNDTVLEIGSGCGAVTGSFLKKGCKVTALDLSYRRCLINAYRHRDYDNLNICVSNISKFSENSNSKYKCVTLIGVLEYAAAFISTDFPYRDILKKSASMLDDDGVLIVAIENRLGLKYFAGCREDHLGICFRSIEGYMEEDRVRTFSRSELLRLFESAGLECEGFYYPYPDYKFPKYIYSDQWLPKKGELTDNQRNFDADRFVVFDESKAFDGIISAGLFPEFSNSFLVCLKKK